MLKKKSYQSHSGCWPTRREVLTWKEKHKLRLSKKPSEALIRRWVSHINKRRGKGQIKFCITFSSEHQMTPTLMSVRAQTKFISHIMFKHSNYFFNYVRSVSSLQKHTSKCFGTWIYASQSLWCSEVRDLENTTIGIYQHIVTLEKKRTLIKCYPSSSTVCCWVEGPVKKGVFRANKDIKSVLFIIS